MLIESIPNISEGRDKHIINTAADVVRGTPGCTLMHIESDPDHNRSVLSFLGEPQNVLCVAFNLARYCVEHIDLRNHNGVHPRMGAIDVIPFVPIRGATMDDCVSISRQLAKRLWTELALPVFLYERSASADHRRNLADVRAGQFEGLPEKMLRPEWTPDFGGSTPHPSAGAVAVGARMPLIAFNVNLNTKDVAIARAIAKAIRASSGGLPCVKALGLYLAAKDCAQVSVNLIDYTVTPLHAVLNAVKREAACRGVGVKECELIGLAPMNAMADAAAHYMQLTDFDRDSQILEMHMLR